MTDLDQLLVDTFERHAADAPSTSGAGLAEVVTSRGRRTVRRRRLAGTGMAAAALVLGVGLTATHWLPDRAAPAPGGGTQGVTAPTQGSYRDVTDDALAAPGQDAQFAWAKSLPVAELAVPVPHAERRDGRVVLVLPSATATFPAEVAAVFSVVRAGAGYVAITHSTDFTGAEQDLGQVVYAVESTGALRVLHRGPVEGAAVDPTGTLVAIGIEEARGPSTTGPLRVTVDIRRWSDGVATGRVRTAAEPVFVRGWTSAGVLLGAVDSATGFRLWEPKSGTEQELPFSEPLPVPGDPDHLLVFHTRVMSPAEDGRCLYRYDVRTASMVGSAYPACLAGSVGQVSPDGRLYYTNSAVIDLTTGGVIWRTPSALNSQALWVDGTHLAQPFGPTEDSLANATWVSCDVLAQHCGRLPGWSILADLHW